MSGKATLLNAEKRVAGELLPLVLLPRFSEPCFEEWFGQAKDPQFTDPQVKEPSNEDAAGFIVADPAVVDQDEFAIKYGENLSGFQWIYYSTMSFCCRRNWLRFEVSGLPTKIFVNTTIPDIHISLVPIGGGHADEWERRRNTDLSHINVELSVHNRWANVTSDVFPQQQMLYTLHQGQLVISSRIFKEISSIHGGFFRFHLDSLDFLSEIAPFVSEKITVVSHNTPRKWSKLSIDAPPA
jgi:hypothetical protein